VNSSIVLVSAVLASLAIGVLGAYGLCATMFRIFRIHVTQVAAERRARAVLSAAPVVE
jgi:ABC-type glycerol-3-phosphate transport system permease component